MGDWTWKPIKDIVAGEEVFAVDDRIKGKRTKVLKTFHREAQLYKITSDTGSIYLTKEHPVLTEGCRWRHIGQDPVEVGRHIKKPFVVTPSFEETEDYKIGYLSGALRGDANISQHTYIRKQKKWEIRDFLYRFRFTVKDKDFMDRVEGYLIGHDFLFREYPFDMNGVTHKAIYNYSKTAYDKITDLVKTPEQPTQEWLRGFIAGLFDAEGSLSTDTVLRFSNTNIHLLELVMKGLSEFGFNSVLERYEGKKVMMVRLRGGLEEKAKFFLIFQTAITRKKDRVFGHILRHMEEIKSIEKDEVSDVYNLETESGNYIAEGFVVHNCFEGDNMHVDDSLKYDFEAIRKTLLEVWKGPYQGSDVCLHGGECLLTPLPELEKLLSLMFNLPWKTGGVKGTTSIMTNASLITEKHIELFKKYNTNVGISIDGPPHLNVLRGPNPKDASITKQYNEQINSTIRRLREMRVPVSLICVLHSKNAGTKEARQQLGGWLLQLKEMGINGGRMNPVDCDDHPEYELDNDQLFQMWVNVYGWNKKYGLHWNPVVEMEKNLTGENKQPSPCSFNRCDPFNTHTLSILADGQTGNCDRTFGRGFYPRSKSNSSCGRYEALQQTECNGCRYWKVCYGQCPCEATGDDWRRKTRWCEAVRRTYAYIEKKLKENNPSVKLVVDEPVTTQERHEAMGNQAHGDSPHGDSNHNDGGHGDSLHGDAPHFDSLHGDVIHGDSIHGDSSHADGDDWRK